MKECGQCGCYNKDQNYNCADCGAKLDGKAVDFDPVVKNQINRLADTAYLLEPSRFERWFRWIYPLCAVGSLFLGIFTDLVNGYCVALAVAFYAAGFVSCSFPKALWALVQFDLSFTVRESNLEPSHFWLLTRKIGYVFLLLSGFIMLLLGTETVIV